MPRLSEGADIVAQTTQNNPTPAHCTNAPAPASAQWCNVDGEREKLKTAKSKTYVSPSTSWFSSDVVAIPKQLSHCPQGNTTKQNKGDSNKNLKDRSHAKLELHSQRDGASPIYVQKFLTARTSHTFECEFHLEKRRNKGNCNVDDSCHAI